MIVTASSVRCIQAKTGLPLLNQISGWTVLCTLLSSLRRQSLTMSTMYSYVFTASVHLSGGALYTHVEDSDVPPRVWALFRHPFHKCRGHVLRCVLDDLAVLD